MWCRAEVIDIMEPTLLSVFFLDFGCHVTVSLANVNRMTREWMRLPKWVVPVALTGTYWKMGNDVYLCFFMRKKPFFSQMTDEF